MTGDLQRITIILDTKEPWFSQLWLDDQQILNVFAVKLEQSAPNVPLTLELSTYGDYLHTGKDWPHEVWIQSYCPSCKQNLTRLKKDG